jgi:hypothetical protein
VPWIFLGHERLGLYLPHSIENPGGKFKQNNEFN